MEKFKKVDSEITLYHGDCLKEMDNIEAGSVDLILTDPPYGTINGCKFGSGEQHKKTAWDNVIDIKKMYGACEKVLRQKGL